MFLPERRFERRVSVLAAARAEPSPQVRQQQASYSYAEMPSLQNRLRLAASGFKVSLTLAPQAAVPVEES